VQKNVSLAAMTSFRTGGKAENYVLVDDNEKLSELLISDKLSKPWWILGDGTNVLISDKGLKGTVIHLVTKRIEQPADTILTAEAGAGWDDLVKFSLKKGLWGIELASGIPGTVGAAVAANIAAYGHAANDCLLWVESINLDHPLAGIQRFDASAVKSRYHTSVFQEGELKSHLIIKTAFSLSKKKTKDLSYYSAVLIADELGLDVDGLSDRRKIIMEARKRAGSLYDPKDAKSPHTGGSFFRNPEVDFATAEKVMSFDEGHVAKSVLKAMNKEHGGATTRVSAAHVLLAAGFRRGQTWGKVRLLPSHVLKIENYGGAKAQDIYNVSQEIIKTVKDKLAIDIVPEVKCLGDFK